MSGAVEPSSASARHRHRLWLAFLITSGILVLEIVGGALSGSLALLADAGHMATDVAGIGLSLFAIGLGARKPDEGRTFGLLRGEILAAAANSLLLFGVAAFVLFEAWQRLQEPPEVTAGLMLAIAIVGGAANGVSLWLLHGAQRESLNMRGAYLEVLGDLLGSLAVVVAAVVVAMTGFVAADSIASAVIAVLILPRTWTLLREAIDVLLEATPRGVDMAEVFGSMLLSRQRSSVGGLGRRRSFWDTRTGQASRYRKLLGLVTFVTDRPWDATSSTASLRLTRRNVPNPCASCRASREKANGSIVPLQPKTPAVVDHLVLEDTPAPSGRQSVPIPPDEPPEPVAFHWPGIAGLVRQLNEPDPQWWTDLDIHLCRPRLSISGC